MSEIENGNVEEQVVEEMPASEDIDNQDVEQDVEGYQEVDETSSERERILQSRVDEQERIIRLLQESSQNEAQQPVQQEYDDDEIITRGTANKMLEDRLSDIKQQQRQLQIDASVEIAKSKYPDYDRVAELGKNVVGNNPDMTNSILNAKNPAELLYNLGKAHPDFQKASGQSNNGKKAKQNLNKPNTLTQAGGGSPATQKNWSTASRAEVEKKLQEVMFGR